MAGPAAVQASNTPARTAADCATLRFERMTPAFSDRLGLPDPSLARRPGRAAEQNYSSRAGGAQADVSSRTQALAVLRFRSPARPCRHVRPQQAARISPLPSSLGPFPFASPEAGTRFERRDVSPLRPLSPRHHGRAARLPWHPSSAVLSIFVLR